MKSKLTKKLSKLYKKGYSLSQLSKKFNIPKSTIYYNLDKLNIIRKKNPIKSIKKIDDYLIGTFLGFWAGDGSKFYDKGYIVKLHLDKNKKQLVQFLKSLLNNLFNKKISVYNDGGNRISLDIFSKFVFDFIDEYVTYEENKTATIRLKNKEYSKKFLDGFILGLILSDGYLKNKNIVFTTISKNLANDIKKNS